MNKSKLDWQLLPKLIMNQVSRIIADIEPETILSYQGTRVYASINPEYEKDNRLSNWLNNTLSQMTGFYVKTANRSVREKYVFCNYCKSRISNCPKCSKTFVGAPEKGVDSQIVTDMFSLFIDKVYDVAVLLSSDSDMVPMVKYLQNHGVKIINLAWDRIGFELKKSCWASVSLDSISNQLVLV